MVLQMKNNSKKQKTQEAPSSTSSLPVLFPDTAGIDIGSKSHFVAVPCERNSNPVREFSTFTADLHKMVNWLKDCKIKTIIMESTGVFWIPAFELLESNGFDVKLVNARHVKNVSAHKTDVLDCQWLQQLGTFGLIKGAFRPANTILPLRAYLRQRDMLIKNASTHILHMQKALTQMNLQLHNVISDITGATGIAIIRSIVAGVTDPKVLASLRNERCRNPEKVIEASLVGNYRQEHLFSLKQALELYDYYMQKISECDYQIEEQAKKLETGCDPKKLDLLKRTSGSKLKQTKKPKKTKKHEYPFDLTSELIRIAGVDLTKIPSIGASTALTVISEIGLDMSRWRSAKSFASWLGLCPGNKISGGKKLSGKTKPCANRVAIALRNAANTLYRSECAFGAFLRRMKARLGSPKAITALAHKLAKLIYIMLKYGHEYIEKGVEFYEAMYQKRREESLRKKAAEMGYDLTPKAA
jgi:transposase